MPPLSMVDPTFKVAMDARPSNYEVTHVSWERPASNLNWYRYVLVRNPKGYPTAPDDGQVIFPNYSSTWDIDPSITPLPSIGFTDDVIIIVDSVSTGGVVTGATVKESGASSGIAMTSVSPISTNGLKGKNLVVSISTGGIITVVSGGGDYAVFDKLRISSNSLKDPTGVSTSTLPGVTSTTQLGITNTYHLYDNSSTYATTANPGVTAGTNPYAKQYNKYYYSLFAYVAPSSDAPNPAPYISDIIPLVNVGNNSAYLGFTWIKLGEASSVVVHQNTTRSTKDVLLDHLPAFYSGKNNFNQNKDLSDFLSLFAFHLDVYLAETKSVFNMADAETTDEALLKQFLKQFGSELTQISDLTQARKVLANIVRNYSLGGSTLGLKNLIESYTGNAVTQIQGLNILPDYNTSSFVENIGNWYPVPSTTTTGSYEASDPYNYTTTPANVNDAFYTNEVALLCNPAFSTVNVSPHASYLGKLAYTGTGTVTNNYETTAVTSAIVTTSTSPTSVSSYTVVVDDTSKIKLGSIPLVVSSTGTFSAQTVVTYIAKDSKTFKINIPPSVEIPSGATLAFSNSITSSSLSLWAANTASTRTISFYNGMRKGYTSATTVASTSSIVNGYQYISAIKPNIAKVGDYVSGHSSIPSGTKVIGFGTNATTRTKLSNKLTANLPINTLLNFSSKPSTELGAAVDMIPVSPSTPYAFGIHHNANNGTPKDVSVNLTWYDINGIIISTTTTTSSAVSTTSPLANTDAGKTWYPTHTQGISPSNAAYVSPEFSIISANGSGTSRYCVDSAMLVRPINVIKKSRTSNVATLTTDVPHNFWYSTTLVNGRVAVTISDDSSFNTTNALITGVVQNNLGTYTFSYANVGSNVTATTTTGYAASFPMIDATIGGKTILLTAFQDARNTTLEVVADRVNAVYNSSFDYDTVGTPSTAYDWSTYTSCTINVADTVAYTGSNYVNVVKGATGSALPAGIIQTNYMKAVSGKAYSASCRILGANQSVKIGIHWYNISGTELSVSYGDSEGETSGQWIQLKSENKTAPANAVYAKLSIESYQGATGARSFNVDGIMFEQSETVNPYFNGDFDGYNYLSTRNSMWQGTPGQSRSHLYKNRALNKDNIDSLAIRGINYA